MKREKDKTTPISSPMGAQDKANDKENNDTSTA